MEIQEVVVDGPEQVALRRGTLDEGPLGAGEALIQSEVTFISSGTEIAIYSGNEPQAFQPGQWCTFPFRPGYANVGRVVEVGPDVARVRPGDRVFSYGKHASALRYNQERLLVAVPPGMDGAVAAASRLAGVALTALLVAELRGNPTVAVFGLGPVGNLAAQAFHARGCRVIGVDPVAERRALATRCGIPTTVGGTPAEVDTFVKEASAGRGADISVDAVGHSAVVAQALTATAAYGQVIILGTPRVPVQGNLTEILRDIHMRFITVRGALEWQLPMYPTSAGNPVSQFSKQELVFDWIERGLLRLEPLISHRLPAAEIARAYGGLHREPARYTGVALLWQEPPTP